MRLVLLDKFGLDMFESYPVNVTIDKVDVDEVCITLENGQEFGYLVNIINDEKLVMGISGLCGFELMKGVNKEEKLKEDDKVYVVQKNEENLTFYEVWVNS